MSKLTESDDVEGECNAHIYIGDDYGDGTATFRCQLLKDHDGPHREDFMRGILTWQKDERDWNIYEECEKCEGFGFEMNVNEPLEVDEDGCCIKCEGMGKLIVGNLKES